MISIHCDSCGVKIEAGTAGGALAYLVKGLLMKSTQAVKEEKQLCESCVNKAKAILEPWIKN